MLGACWHAVISAATMLLLPNLPFHADAQVTITSSTTPIASILNTPSTCPSRSVNYITQTLPQQCLTTSWVGKPTSRDALIAEAASTSSGSSNASLPSTSTISAFFDAGSASTVSINLTQLPSSASSTAHLTEVQAALTKAESAATAQANTETGQESETESPLDNAHFLSFEEWKRQNLAKAGQSAENLDQRAGAGKEQRRRLGNINNALDSLGEDTEIDIDFGGFVNPGPIKDAASISGVQGKETGELELEKGRAEQAVQENTGTRKQSKDAGKTCKERTNYASYDCAATTLKTNPECKSSSALLVENKDSYMLNICSAPNKFFIVELCDAILIDTVVLANFEFFSSMFRNFRVSVSDRYPVKLDKWRELGTYEARNSREVQAFLVENPLIWARYLRVEFLTHYGNEYYCPVSLLRVHGTTMMEEFNAEVKNAGVGDDLEGEEAELEAREHVHGVPGLISAEVLDASPDISLEQTNGVLTTAIEDTTSSTADDAPSSMSMHLPNESASTASPSAHRDFSAVNDESFRGRLDGLVTAADENHLVCLAENQPVAVGPPTSAITSSAREIHTPAPSHEVSSLLPTYAASISLNNTILPNMSSISRNMTSSTSLTGTPTNSSASQVVTKTPSSNVNSTSASTVKVHTSSTQPPTTNPTTQESFFKSVHKRLQLLEANSTLSLQYIEEQSRILRDAFSKVEKRQLAKTSAFLETLNTTVLTELHEFRMQYDQIWQSTVLELSSQREQSEHEAFALSTRLSLLADEIVFQKRMAILQFLLILLCLGLVIFSRHSSAATYLELPPLVQNAINRSSANFSRDTPHSETPPTSPSASRPPSRYGIFRNLTHQRSPSQDSYAPPSIKNPNIEYSSRTPDSPGSMTADADSYPEQNHKVILGSSLHQAGEETRLRSPSCMRNGTGLEQKEVLLPSDATVEGKLNGEARKRPRELTACDS
ncbi:MAG: hypothetical protein Q9163_003402 [Psora crenata]